MFLSSSGSDLNALARAYDVAYEPKPTMRIASGIASAPHPKFSFDGKT
jgi:hypothetical protein